MIDDYLALIPAAGVGSRAQLSTAKQFLKIGEKTILEHAIDPFIKDENCKKICVVTNEEDDLWPSLSISNQEKIISCYGGTTRMNSVLAGLELLIDQEDKSSLVAIHDAARPCLQIEDLKNLMEYADEEIVDRLILIMVNEAVRCLQEEVVNSPKDVDFGMIMGTGWAPFRGGPISYLDNLGALKVVQKLNELAKKNKYFTPCDMLIEYAEKNKKFYGEK